MRNVERILAVLLLVGFISRAPASPVSIHVATNGNDRASGGVDAPLATLAAAVQWSRQAPGRETNEVRIVLHGGTHLLESPLLLTAEDSGLVIEAFRHETPVISGQKVIRGWRYSRSNPNIWQTEIPEVRSGNWVFHELFVNGQRMQRTRLPDHGFYHMVGMGVPRFPTELQVRNGDFKPEWVRDGDVELITYEAWAQTRNQIREFYPASNIVSLAGDVFVAGAQKDGPYFIENAPVPLSPGQWRVDRRTGLITVWPNAGDDIPTVVITAPRLYDLVHITGRADQPAHDIVFRGITFADADWRLDGGSDLDAQAAVETPGAVQARFARHCTFERCTFERLGGYALELGPGCVGNQIVGNEMRDLGAGGIRVGLPDYGEATSDPTGGNEITDNHIHDIGLVNAPGVGIFVLLSGGNHIAHNEVDHTFYTAISVGWTWGYGATPCSSNIVEFNHLHDIGQGLLADMGGIYTLGIQRGAIVRNNLIHDVTISGYGGWGLYTDEGSSGIVLESNVVYRCQSAGFHQHYGQTNVIRNNVFAFNQEAQIAHTRFEPGISFIFTNNIVYYDSGKLFAGNWKNDVETDCNLYFDTRTNSAGRKSLEAFHHWQDQSHDLYSLFADPRFVAPRRLDFRLQPDSPAWRLGMGQIDVSSAGVRPKYQR